jgi:1,4-alpha-glucan branching enzyme
MISKSRSENGKTRVTFEVPHTLWAERICVVGDFNDWDRHKHPLTRDSRDDPTWRITLELEPDQSYQFRYLIDDKTWCNDPAADRYGENPFGGHNSIIET